MNIFKILTATLLTLYFGVAIGSSESEKTTIGDAVMTVTSNSPAFETVKKKLGKWEGQMTQSLNGDVFDVSYEWKLTSGETTITETIVEDGVEMLTTYSDQDGELIIKHYCALGTEPVFKVSDMTASAMSISFDAKKSSLHADHHSFVTEMKWTMNSKDENSMIFENKVTLDGELTTNRAVLKRSLQIANVIYDKETHFSKWMVTVGELIPGGFRKLEVVDAIGDETSGA